MQITITTASGELHSIEVDDSFELENLKALLEADLNIAAANQILVFQGTELTDGKKTISQYGIKNHDVLFLTRKANNNNFPGSSSSTASSSSSRRRPPQTANDFWSQEPEVVRQSILNSPEILRSITLQSPQLAEAARSNPAEFAKMVAQIRENMKAEKAEKDLSEADPFDVEAQKKIEDMIRMQNVLQNMETAIEHNPEAFGRVCMLYVMVKVNGHDIKAFVDSGAQATIISPTCAEKCGIMRLLDSRFAGIAMGVGTAKILGRIHSAPLRIGNANFPVSFTVLEGKGVELLFGLDLLKRFQACIDLKENVLRIADQVVPFLPEHEIPQSIASPTEPSLPSSSANAVASSSSPSQAPQAPSFPEADVKSLMSLGGVTREKAIQFLRMAGGNVEMAASFIFEQ